MGGVLRAIPLPLRIVAVLLVVLVAYSVIGSGAGSLFLILAIVLWVLVLVVLAYELGWANALAKVPVLSRFLGYMANRKAISGAASHEPEGGPLGKLDDDERRTLYAAAEGKLQELRGVDRARDMIHSRLLDIAESDPENPFGTQAPAVMVFFSGPRGVGKTTIAKAAAEMMTGISALDTAKIVVLRDTDLRGGDQGTALELGRAKAQAALGGTLLIEDAEWMLEQDPYGGASLPAADIGIGILEVLQSNPRSTLIACTVTEAGERQLRTHPGHSRWVGKLTLRSVSLSHLDDGAILDITLEQLEKMGWSVDGEATMTALRRNLIEIRNRMGDDFDNAEACRRLAEKLVEIAVQEEIETREITREIVKYADEEFE